MAEWLRRGLQILVSQFDSGRCLQKNLVLIKKKSKLCFKYSSVAQLVEQLTVNQLVVGSSPTRGAKNLLKQNIYFRIKIKKLAIYPLVLIVCLLVRLGNLFLVFYVITVNQNSLPLALMIVYMRSYHGSYHWYSQLTYRFFLV